VNTPAAEATASTAQRPTKLLLACGLAAVLVMWAINYIVAKVALDHIDVLTLLAFRFEIAGAVMLVIFFARGRRTPLQKRHFWLFVCLATFGILMNQGLFITGLNYSIPSHSAIIVAFDPILILVLARAMGLESFSAGKFIGMGLAVAGIVMLEVEQGAAVHSHYLLGDLMTLGSALGFSLYAVLAKGVTSEYDAVALNTFNCVAAAIVFLPVAIHQAVRLDWRSVAWQGWMGVLYTALVSSVLAYLTFYWALRHMDASRVAVINYLQPVLVIMLASAFLGENPSRHLLAGTALVLAGVYLAERGARIV
jgi:drug/metabolite transporter (DMT)-like permease